MNTTDKARLIHLYNKTEGGHKLLSDEEFIEYAALRKKEYLDRKAELIATGKTAKAVKDDAGDIIGWAIISIILLAMIPTASANVIAWNDTEQSNLPNGALVKVNFNGESYDTMNEWNTATSTFTASQAGWYLITGKLLFMYTVANRDYIAYVQKNDPGVLDGNHRAYFAIGHANAINSAAGLTVPIIFVDYLNTGDNLTVYAQSNSGNNQVAIGGLCAAGQWCGEPDKAYYSIEIVKVG